MKDISVIMPLYNAAKYLPEALQSVLRQTYSNFELICIDDCSTDNTGTILEQFQQKDNRIRSLTNKERMGAALSRNEGLKTAVGQYVVFLDGDDVFEEELLEKARDTMKKYHVDIVLFELLHVTNEEIYTKRVIERSEDFITAYCRKPFAVSDLGIDEFPSWSSSPCNKMFRKSFIKENRLEFQNLPSSNDVYFVKMALLCAKKIIWLDDRRVMVYAREHSEPSRISNDRDPMYSYLALEKLFREAKERNMFSRLAGYLYYILATCLLFLLRKEKEGERKKEFYYFIQNEGISNCIAYGEEYYGEIQVYYRYILESFMQKSYESRWFNNLDTHFQVYLREFGEQVSNFVKDKLSQNKKVILWGMGKNGTFLLQYLMEHEVKLSGIVDSDNNKQGLKLNGYVIESPENICRTADYILVTSEVVYQAVKKVINDTKAVCINVFDILEGYK